MRPIRVVLVLVALVLCTDVSSPQDNKAQGAEDKPKVVKEQIRGGIVFPAEKRMWTRITGKVKVVNAYTLRLKMEPRCVSVGASTPRNWTKRA